MEKLLQFIKSQKVMTIATADERGPWTASVYYAVADDGVMYFVSTKDARHSEMILKNNRIAFSIAWHNKKNSADRKGVQGLGICETVHNPLTIMTAVKALNASFPDLKNMITVEWIATNMWGARIWSIKPSYAKYYDDEVYGEEESKEFNF